ncbi:MAG: hypothetical protein DCC67_07060 [Planctomycetota bacterium]|nr:MAG: hypothetical protein DCC67_07060 [Planctomycetota bacterium]
MAPSEKHFVAYHNTEGMGRPLSDGDPFRVLTNKAVTSLQEAVVWMIVGEGKNPRRFSLGSMFRVTETGDAAEEGFKHFAAGRGHAFNPPLPLNELEWFDDFKRAMNGFQFGIQPLSSEQHVAALVALAEKAGCNVP